MQVSDVNWAATAIGAAVGVLVLATFYTVVRTEWPVNYASLTRDPGVVVNRSFGKYSLFALAPTYIVALLASTLAGREGGHAMVCALAIGILHTWRTQAMRILHTLRLRRAQRSNPILIFSIITGIGLLFMSWLGGLGPGPAQLIVPPLEEFFNAFWTTALVVVLAVFITRSTTVTRDITDLIERSRRELGSGLVRLTSQTALDHDTDPLLAEAILLTENLQRPSWFRRLEKLKAVVWPAGTYGPMQVWSPQPLTDEESVTRAVTEHLSGTRVRETREGGPDRDLLRRILRRYNRNPAFVDLAESIYEDLYYRERWGRS